MTTAERGTSPMRVLTVVRDLGLGGTQRAAQNYAIGYRSEGQSAAVLAHTDGGPRADVLTALGIPVWIGGADLQRVDEAVDLAAEWNPNVIHVHRPGRPEPVVARILRALRPRLQVGHVVLETNVFSKVDHSGDRSLVDLHMHLTRWGLWKWTQWTSGMRPRPFGVVLPYFVDASRFHPIAAGERDRDRRGLGIPQDAFVFGRIAQPLMPKWSPMIFDAFAEVASRHSQAHLLLVGLPEPLRKRLRALPAPVRDRVLELSMMSSDDELRTCYGAMDVFLHASAIGESFGMVLVEAMLCGRPVITLSTPANDNGQVEVVGHGTGGFVVNNRKSMVHAMELLLEDRTLRERLGAQGAASVRERYGLAENMHLLVGIAAVALGAKTPALLRSALEEKPHVITEVSRSEVEALLERSLGSVSATDRLLMDLVHRGRLYRLYSRFLFPIRQMR
jgi:glycosyltransferase involved in cell wall biosynthesis